MHLEGYIDVATRLRMAFTKYPDLRIVEHEPRLVADGAFLEVQITVYRSPDDPLPTCGRAWERYPGQTAFTKNSEMMTAATSALGRALRYMGLGLDEPAIASQDEVRPRLGETPNRPGRTKPPIVDPYGYVVGEPKTESDPAGEIPRPASEKQRNYVAGLARTVGRDIDVTDLTNAEAQKLIDELKPLADQKRHER